ncbi:MAG: hypothetical protein CMN73_11065 [Sphingomonas sp.]|nr:hypothetical protein [Sphingomonas sp.]
MKKLLVAATLFFAIPTASAQTARPALDYASAATIRDTCIAWAQEHGRKMAVAVMDSHGMLITYAHMDGVSYGAGDIAKWKATAASRFGRSTQDLGALNPPPGMPNVATMTGGVPIYTSDGFALGGVGASGGRPEEDAACGTAGIEAAGLIAARPAPAPAQ